jgi:hypothetical protein
MQSSHPRRYATHDSSDERVASLQHQTCKACGNRDKFDFTVPDEVWASVVPDHLRTRVVCLPCFDDFAQSRGIDYAAHVSSLYFAGDGAAFEFRVVSASDADDYS